MSNKSKVYHIPLDTSFSKAKTTFSMECVLTHRIFHLFDIFLGNDVVGIKINSCENPKNNLHQTEHITHISKLLQNKYIYPALCDTSWKFKNRKDSAANHLSNMFKLGLSFEKTNTPFIMLDGANGGSELSVELSKNSYVHLAGEVENLDGAIFISSTIHNPLAGFEGALNNMGFGMASKKGKSIQHSTSCPEVNSSKCYYCRKCLHECPTGAIFVKDRRVEIARELCINCGKCVEIAQYGGIAYDWNATPDYYQRKVARYAKGVANILKKKMLFCNLLPCDPHNKEQEDISFSGILISKDPLAIDVATQELLQNNSNFAENMTSLFESATKQQLGNIDYELITINY